MSKAVQVSREHNFGVLPRDIFGDLEISTQKRDWMSRYPSLPLSRARARSLSLSECRGAPVYVSVCLSLCLYVCLCVCMSVSVSVSVSF
jgi:hypothetical protein